MSFAAIDGWQSGDSNIQLLETRALLDPGSAPSLDFYADNSGDYSLDYFALTMRKLYEEDEELALSAVSNLVERDPTDAMPYYLKAILLIHLGELEDAQVCIRKGNSAPKCMFPAPYPARVAYKNQSLQWSPKNQRAAGIFWGYWSANGSISRWAKEGFKNLEVAVKLGYEPEVMDDYLLMLKRIGQSEQIPLTEQFQ
ncbi:MAG: hypothetical protein M3R04_09370, partial [bacterium]|nr:hypothetical protein [bacterium]